MRRWIATGTWLLGLLLAVAWPAGAAEFDGTWKLAPSMAPAGDAANPPEATLRLKQDGEKFTGTLEVQGKELAILEGVVKGSELQLKVTVEIDGQSRPVTLRATRDGDRLKGTVEGVHPEPVAFTGTRLAATALAGAWNLTITTPDKTHKATVTLTQEGDKLTGTLRGEDGTELTLMAGTVQGEMVRFEIEVNIDGQQLRPRFTGQRTAKGLEGTVLVGDQSFTWVGERTDAPAK